MSNIHVDPFSSAAYTNHVQHLSTLDVLNLWRYWHLRVAIMKHRKAAIHGMRNRLDRMIQNFLTATILTNRPQSWEHSYTHVTSAMAPQGETHVARDTRSNDKRDETSVDLTSSTTAAQVHNGVTRKSTRYSPQSVAWRKHDNEVDNLGTLDT